MLNALVAGERDPDVFAELARRQMRKKIPALREALAGHFDEHHRLWIGPILAHIDFLDQQIERLTCMIEYLKKIYTAIDRDHAEQELERFADKWDQRYPMISASWIEHWERIVPFLAFPPDVRRVVYTTNTIEALNRQIRKIIKTRGHFPDHDAARKLLYLAITNAQKNWRTAHNWSSALAAFRIHFGDRIPDHAN
jgi:transposase-like protein